MNQILLTDIENKKKKNNNKNTNKDNSNDIKKIIIFFSVVILVFGVAIGGVYTYKLTKNKKGSKEINNEIKLDLQTAEEQVIVIAETEVGISKITYSWDDGEEIEEELNGRTKEQKTIDIPYGESTLKVKIIDLNGKQKEITKTYEREEPDVEEDDSIDINVSIVETDDGNKIKIVATAQNPIEYMEYRWNEEENIKIESEEEQLTIQNIIDVKRGNNKLTITVKDSEGNINSLDKKFDGRYKPEINVTKKRK